jgi:glucose 1-dehydrogenase
MPPSSCCESEDYLREFLRRGPAPALSAATGKIVFTSSVHEAIPWSFQSNYTASKAGMTMLMQTSRRSWGR